MIFEPCEQGSELWHLARAGGITASMFSTARTILKSGKNKGDYSSAAHDYAYKLAVERRKCAPLDHDEYETRDMRRGRELEHSARLVHEQKLGIFVEQAGYVCTDDRRFGYSTDGFIGDDGMAEYKCFTSPSKIRDILFNDSADVVIDQVQGGLWLTNRKWCDFCLYSPDMEDFGLDLVINRIYRDDEYIAELEQDLLRFDALVEGYMARLIDRGQRNKAFIESLTGFTPDTENYVEQAEPEESLILDNVF